MKNAILTAAASLVLFSAAIPAMAAEVTNADAEELVLTVTENGVRSEVAVQPSQNVNICNDGCFISFPSGEMMPLKGKEKVVIENGKGRIEN